MSLSGWLNIYKPKGVSSARIVSKIKRLLKAKIGHAGTLDPLAEGILPIAVGEATKLSSYLVDAKKCYEFKIQFGSMTDTGDAEGKETEVTNIIPESFEECCNITPKFLGKITQIPSKYSAIKIDGHRAYDLARKNIDFEMKSREITIYSLKCLSYENGVASYVAECSKGTYIRTLAEDISKSLQSLGFVIELRRLKVGIFCEEDSVHDLEDLEAKLMKTEAVLDDILELQIDAEIVQNVRNGKKIYFDQEDTEDMYLTFEGNIVAIGIN